MPTAELLPFTLLYLSLFIFPSMAATAAARVGAAKALGVPGLTWLFGGAVPATTSTWRRVAIVFGGALAGYAVSATVFFGAGLAGAGATPNTEVEVAPDRPAAKAGLITGDRVRAVGGVPVATFDEIRAVVAKHPGEPVEFVVARGAEELRLVVTPEDSAGQGKVGVTAKGTTPRGLGGSLVMGVTWPARIVVDVVQGIGALLTGRKQDGGALASPVTVILASARGAGDVLVLLGALLSYGWPFALLASVLAFPRRSATLV